MKYTRAMLLAVCFLVVGGGVGAVRADDPGEGNPGVTIYTASLAGDSMFCNAVNVSGKTLGITIAILDNLGQEISCASPNACLGHSNGGGFMPTTNPNPEFQVLKGAAAALLIAFPTGSLQDGYCAVSVSGTGNRDNVRVGFGINRTTTIPGTTTSTVITRDVEGH